MSITSQPLTIYAFRAIMNIHYRDGRRSELDTKCAYCGRWRGTMGLRNADPPKCRTTYFSVCQHPLLSTTHLPPRSCCHLLSFVGSQGQFTDINAEFLVTPSGFSGSPGQFADIRADFPVIPSGFSGNPALIIHHVAR